MMLAVCFHCGNKKNDYVAKCGACQFQPQSPEDMVKSLILSTAYDNGEDYRGKTKEELYEIASAIAKGHPYIFDDAEVQSVIEYDRRAALPAKQLVIDGLRWLLPPILLLAFVYFLLFWKS